MPELPEVETTRRGLAQSVIGQRIARVEVRRRDLRTPIPAHLEETLTGRTITAVRRRAKYLLLDMDSEEVLLIHLGMSGSVTVRKNTNFAPKTHDHVIFYLENGNLAVFHDPRRFGVVDCFPKSAEKTHPLLIHLGPEPFSEDFSPKYLETQLKKRKGPIKTVLMDQKLVVGVGNIYASEALYACRIHPELPAIQASGKSKQIIDSIRLTLQAAIDSGGSTLRDYVGAGSEGGYFQHQFRVYERDGDPCFECQTPIKIGTHAGRSTYWCPQCQQIRRKRQKT